MCGRATYRMNEFNVGLCALGLNNQLSQKLKSPWGPAHCWICPNGSTLIVLRSLVVSCNKLHTKPLVWINSDTQSPSFLAFTFLLSFKNCFYTRFILKFQLCRNPFHQTIFANSKWYNYPLFFFFLFLFPFTHIYMEGFNNTVSRPFLEGVSPIKMQN